MYAENKFDVTDKKAGIAGTQAITCFGGVDTGIK